MVTNPKMNPYFHLERERYTTNISGLMEKSSVYNRALVTWV